MKQKKVTTIISYDYEDKNTVSNDWIADRIKNDLLKGSNPAHEKIESIKVEDNVKKINMDIEKIIFKIANYGAHTWVRYWVQKEISGLTLPGEYIAIRGSFLADDLLTEVLDAGFKIKTIFSKKIDADAYCDVLLMRKLK